MGTNNSRPQPPSRPPVQPIQASVYNEHVYPDENSYPVTEEWIRDKLVNGNRLRFLPPGVVAFLRNDTTSLGAGDYIEPQYYLIHEDVIVQPNSESIARKLFVFIQFLYRTEKVSYGYDPADRITRRFTTFYDHYTTKFTVQVG